MVSLVCKRESCSFQSVLSGCPPLGQVLLLCPVRSTVHVLVHHLITPSYQLSERSFTHKESCKSSCRQFQDDDVPPFTGSCYMVELTLLWPATSLMPHDRVLNTVQETLVVSGGSFSQHSDDLCSYYASHSIQIYYGWPGESIVSFGRECVSRYFHNPIFHAPTISVESSS